MKETIGSTSCDLCPEVSKYPLFITMYGCPNKIIHTKTNLNFHILKSVSLSLFLFVCLFCFHSTSHINLSLSLFFFLFFSRSL